MKCYDAAEIKKAIDFITENKVYESRQISNDGRVRSGYFVGSEKLIEELSNLKLDDFNIYITLNELHPGCYCRKQRDHFIDAKGKATPTTSENDVIAFRWLLLDLDPVRPSGISSSDDELKHSMKIALKVIEFMSGLNFDNYIIALSGNGIHLLYRIDIPATEENKKMLAECLKAVNSECSDDIVKVDAVNFKKSQVCKLYGTLAQKGTNTPERPFRMSRIISLDELKEGASDA